VIVLKRGGFPTVVTLYQIGRQRFHRIHGLPYLFVGINLANKYTKFER
jgi:hypothetical protein